MKKIFFTLLLFLFFIASHAQQKTIRLIVKGDDMGYTHSGNQGIIKSYKVGIETSIEVIVPSPWFAEKENNWKIEDIEKEFRAQIEMALKHIPRISHVSSHMGCTNITDEVKAFTKKLAEEYKVDIDLEDYGVISVSYEGPNKTTEEKIQRILNMLNKLEPGKTYIFIEHPGIDDEELRAVHYIGYEHVAADRQGVTGCIYQWKNKGIH